MKMIDEKKLIEDIKKHFDAIYREDGELLSSDHICISEDVDDLIKLIEKQLKTDCSECSRRKFYQKGYQDGLNADKWIPVEERLPRRNVDVLVYRPKMATPFFVDRYEGFYGEDDNEWYEGWAYSTNCEVVAWRELPAPYKKEGVE